jgi:ubiquinone/menaquinone biosynthesis C-methylase UbiE
VFSGALFLDAGCGTGGMLRTLNTFGIAYGIDIAEEALRKCVERDSRSLVRATVTRIPFRNQLFDLVISLDVLYHDAVDDETKAVQEFYRVMKPSGKLVLNLPAYEFLRSAHDQVIHTRRRFTRGKVKELLCNAGFRIEKLSYRVSFLFPLIAMWKIVRSKFHGGGGSSDLQNVPRLANNFLRKIMTFENLLLKSMNFPFGTSVFCVAVKPAPKPYGGIE